MVSSSSPTQVGRARTLGSEKPLLPRYAREQLRFVDVKTEQTITLIGTKQLLS